MKDTLHKKNTKNRNISIKNSSFSDLLKRFFVVWFLMFFCALVITQQESFWIKTSTAPEQVVFLLPGTASDWGMENEQGTHGAASDWSYLFEDEETDQQVYLPTQGSSSGQQLPSSDELPSTMDQNPSWSVEKDFLPVDDADDIFDENVSWTGKIWLSTGTVLVSSWVSWSLVPEKEYVCITPWGEYVAEKDFVLAYEQRKDVNNLCNVQKRYCVKWKLTWSYLQKSCKENTIYSYVKPEAVSYAQDPVDPFIQPNEPSLSGANFDTHWKINGTTSVVDTWWSPSSGRPTDTTSVGQMPTTQKRCTTPWGAFVPNGQFVKAYKSSVGLIDLPCEVEIRLCAGGKLKWSYTNRTCTFKKMTYRDYLIQNYDSTQPTVWDLVNTLSTEEKETTYKTSSFWKWLDKYF